MDPHLLLAAAEGLGPGLVSALLDPHVDPEVLLAEPPPIALPGRVRQRLRDRASLHATAGAWLAAARHLGIHWLTPADPRYPAALRHAPLRPLVLFGLGDMDLLAASSSAVTIVGSRTPTAYGIAATRDFGRALATAGTVLWSGLAAGVDATAHEACLDCGTPTVAVLGGGLDQVYPANHADLFQRIHTGNGLCLSELPPGARPSRGHFPRRNRILALAPSAVLVVEAGNASGSLHTARFAADAGVPVYAIPGPYTSERSRGCHGLIADGAQIALDPTSLLRELGVAIARRPDAHSTGQRIADSADQRAVLAQLEAGPRPSDLVRRESGLQDGRFLAAVMALLEAGRAQELPGGLLARSVG